MIIYLLMIMKESHGM